jgi:hypothetical protein
MLLNISNEILSKSNFESRIIDFIPDNSGRYRILKSSLISIRAFLAVFIEPVTTTETGIPNRYNSILKESDAFSSAYHKPPKYTFLVAA